MKDYSVDGPVYLGEFITMCRQIMRPGYLFYFYLRDIHGELTETMLSMYDAELQLYFKYKIVDAIFDEDDCCFSIMLLSPDE